MAKQKTDTRRYHPAGGASANAQSSPSPSTAADIDTLIHERTRLGIVSALAAREHVSFTELKTILGATDGNVSAHARKLEEAGYVASSKRFEGRIPRTEYSLTDAGRQALERYVRHMENLLRTVPRR